MRAATPNVPPTMSNISMTEAGSSRGKGGLPVLFATPMLETAEVGLAVGDGRGVGSGIGVGEGPGRIICVCACNAPVVSLAITVAMVCVGSRLVGKWNAPVIVPSLSDIIGVSSNCEDAVPSSRDNSTEVP